jgi:D-3-phosphoglycerate dehydrogenase
MFTISCTLRVGYVEGAIFVQIYMPKILITTVPFSEKDRSPIEKLNSAGVEYLINPLGRKLKEEELIEMAVDFDVLIAGTEPITAQVMNKSPRLKHISRVGIGLDSVDLLAAEKLGIKVSYTPDAPAPAVAELALSLILSSLRFTHIANAEMHRGEWNRHFGRRIKDITIGIIGLGRIGGRLLKYSEVLGFKRILINDINQDLAPFSNARYEAMTKEEIYTHADIITLHIPLNAHTINMVGEKQLLSMKSDAIIINTARGGIINESDLARVLIGGHLGGAAIDVFEQEPYAGPLSEIDSCLLTSHMGSMSIDCRTKMEIEATEEAIRFLTGQELKSPVPIEEYDSRRSR